MIQQLKVAFLSLVVLTVLTGLIYPFAMTAIAQIVFPEKANGSLILKDGKPVGSALIGQSFDDPKYFWGRLSATAPSYNGGASSGSNLGPLNPALTKAVEERIEALRKADLPAGRQVLGNKMPIPVDLVTASGSGLDPHISPAGALYQIDRVGRARGLSEAQVTTLVKAHTQGRFLGFLGEPVVNVLQLNLALDELKK